MTAKEANGQAFLRRAKSLYYEGIRFVFADASRVAKKRIAVKKKEERR